MLSRLGQTPRRPLRRSSSTLDALCDELNIRRSLLCPRAKIAEIVEALSEVFYDTEEDSIDGSDVSDDGTGLFQSGLGFHDPETLIADVLQTPSHAIRKLNDATVPEVAGIHFKHWVRCVSTQSMPQPVRTYCLWVLDLALHFSAMGVRRPDQQIWCHWLKVRLDIVF